MRAGMRRRGASGQTGRAHWPLWLGLLLLAALLRLREPAWDGGIAAHPDERFLLSVAHQVRFVDNICTVVPDFPYGHLPVSLLRLWILTAPDADPLYGARLFSGLIGVLIVAIAGCCAKEIVGSRGGGIAPLIAGAAVCAAPFLIQQGHFFTVDPLGTILASGALLAGGRRKWRAAGALAGLAVATKLSLILAGALLVGWAYWQERASASADDPSRSLGRGVLLAPSKVMLFALLAFALVSPWSFITPIACWRGPFVQGLMAGGRLDFPYTRQYAGTFPWIYPLVQMALWGLGPLVTVMGLVGLLLGLRRTPEQRSAVRRHPAPGLPWIWTVLALLTVGGLKVKFPRYMLPIYPWWAAWAADAVRRLTRRTGVLTRSAVVAVTLGSTAILGIGQAGLYSRPHPWIAASAWIYRHFEVGARIAVEAWDHPLPVPLPDGDPADYRQLALPVFDPDGPEKTAALYSAVVDADAIVVASRRAYAANPGPATIAWYRDLLRAHDGHSFARCPTIGPLAITDDPLADAGLQVGSTLAERCGTPYVMRLPALDESFRVYDAPLTLVMEMPSRQ